MFDSLCQVSLHLIRFPSEQLIQGDWRGISLNQGGSKKGVMSGIECRKKSSLELVSKFQLKIST